MLKVISSEEEYLNTISQKKLVLIDFYADWCGPCNQIAPLLEELSVEFAEKLEIAKIDVDSEETENVCQTNAIQCMPTLVFFKNGQVVKRIEGFFLIDEIRNTIQSSL